MYASISTPGAWGSIDPYRRRFMPALQTEPLELSKRALIGSADGGGSI